MLTTIEFDDQFLGRTVEVYDIWPDRLLPSKAQVRESPAPQIRPQFAFVIGHFPPQLTRMDGLKTETAGIILGPLHTSSYSI